MHSVRIQQLLNYSLVRQLQRIPLTFVAIGMILIPMLVRLVQDWYSFPLPYGTTIGTSDPDPWLRLTLVRDLLTSGDWYNHAVLRSDAPYFQTTTPWTRPIDVVIAAFVKLQPSDVDLSLRLIRAALIMPVLCMGLLLLGICRAVRQLTALPIAPIAAILLVACMPMMRNYFGIGNADHHAMLAAIFVWAFGGILHPSPSVRLTMLSGLLLGLLLWISPEGMMLIGTVFGWYGVLWLVGDGEQARPLPLLTFTTALTSFVAIAIERPPQQWLEPVYDSISIVYGVILACVALVTAILFRLHLPALWHRAIAAGIGIVAVAACVLALYPAMIQGPLANLDPYIYSDFLPRITEAQPLWQKEALYIAAVLIYPLATFAFFTLAWRRSNAILGRQRLLMLGYFIAVTLCLLIHQQRFFYYFGPVTIIALAPFIAALLTPEHPLVRTLWPARWLVALPANAQALRRMPLLAIVAGLQLILISQIPENKTAEQQKIRACSAIGRKLIQHGTLNALGDGEPLTLFISTNLGAEALFFTPHRIIASNYHREGKGIQYIWEADKIVPLPTLREYLASRKVDALFICPAKTSPSLSALQRLQRGAKPPAWLIPVPYEMPPLSKDEKPVDGAAPVIFLINHNAR